MPGVVVGIFAVECSNNEHANDRPKIDIGPWLRSEFSRDWFRGQLCPFAHPPPDPLAPARDKRGPAPVDNGPMALRMQAQGSALFEFVAFCLCLSAAAPSNPFPSFSSYVCPPNLSSPSCTSSFRSVLLLFVLLRSARPSSRFHSANCNRQSAGPLSRCSFSRSPSTTGEASGKR